MFHVNRAVKNYIFLGSSFGVAAYFYAIAQCIVYFLRHHRAGFLRNRSVLK